MTYADTSALVKLLLAEPETTPLRAALAALTEPLTSSELTIAERLAHLDRRRDSGELGLLEHQRLHHALVQRG